VTPALTVRNVSKAFGRMTAVSDVSFEVAPGEVFGLAGPNGAGKSTLFNVLTGIPFGPDAGEIELAGRPIARLAPYRIARAGLTRTFQTEAVFGQLTVADHLRLCAARTALGKRLGDRVRACGDALETVGLREPDVLADTLSLVDRKRLMIATAIVAGPAVLLLDEPAAGLEPQDQDELVVLLRRVNAAGVAVVLIEHVLRVLRAVCGRMAVLDAGRVIASGSPDVVLSDPRVMTAYLGPRGADQ